jgi:hypothetical protein
LWDRICGKREKTLAKQGKLIHNCQKTIPHYQQVRGLKKSLMEQIRTYPHPCAGISTGYPQMVFGQRMA